MYTECDVIHNTEVCPGYGRVTFHVPDIAAPALPGQFVMLRYWNGHDPFLMRPFSINSIDKKQNTLEILYKVVGEGTKILQTLQPGAPAQMLGPLGKAFPLAEGSRRIAVIGRGVGAAPMRYLAEMAAARGVEVHAYISAGKEEHLFDREFYQAAGCKFTGCTDAAVNVTSFFENELKQLEFDAAYVCGSKRLMKDVSQLMDQYGFAGYVSLEEHMACGIGACKGCVCQVHQADGTEEYARVCKEGPVFPIKQIVGQETR